MTRHVYECPMRWADMDVLGHVNNVIYVDYLQEARVDMLRTHGPAAQTGDLAEGVVVVRHEVHYTAPLAFRFQPVTIECWVTEIRAASFTMAYEIFQDTEPQRVEDISRDAFGQLWFARQEAYRFDTAGQPANPSTWTRTVLGADSGLNGDILRVIFESAAFEGAAMTPIGFIVSSPFIPAAARRWGAGRVALSCAVASAMVLALIGWTQDLGWWFPLRFLIGFTTNPLYVLSEVWIIALAPAARAASFAASICPGVAPGCCGLVINCSVSWVSGYALGRPASRSSSACAYAPTSCAVENTPACPATPPIRRVVVSFTVPRSR